MISIGNPVSFEGPNIWSTSPVTRLIVHRGSAADYQPKQRRELEQQIIETLGVFTTTPSTLTALDPLPHQEAPSIAGTIAKLAIDLQRATGADVTFYMSRPAAAGGHEVVTQHVHPKVGLNAARLAVRVLNHFILGTGSFSDLSQQFARLMQVAASRYFTPANRAIADAAIRRGIPVSVVDPRGMRVELGTGIYRRRIASAITSNTSSIGAAIARDKHLTNHYLRQAGLPVPEGGSARTLEQALAVANRIGYPVVIKPVDLGDSVGVFVDVRDDADVRVCFASISDAASKASGKLLVERFISGNEYRALIVDQQIISIFQRVPPFVTGDGQHSVQHLLDLANADQRRGKRLSDPLKPIVIDDKMRRMLDRAHLTLSDIPAAGQRVQLKPTGHISSGGAAHDCTDRVHPDTASVLRQAVRVIGIDIAGIDFIAEDIEQSIVSTGGAIIEVNDGPVVTTHLYPAEGPSRDFGQAVVDMLFPPGTPVRAPVVAVCGGAETALVVERIASLLAATGKSVGVVTNSKLTVDGLALGEHASNYQAARRALNHPMVEVAVLATPADEIVEHGLPFDRCDVAVITAASDVEIPGLWSPEQLLGQVAAASVERLVPNAVLSAHPVQNETIESIALEVLHLLVGSPTAADPLGSYPA